MTNVRSKPRGRPDAKGHSAASGPAARREIPHADRRSPDPSGKSVSTHSTRPDVPMARTRCSNDHRLRDLVRQIGDKAINKRIRFEENRSLASRRCGAMKSDSTVA